MFKVALVTGASRGIGKAIASRLSKDGYRVAISDLTSQRGQLEELRDELSKTYKRPFISVADVSVEREVENMVSDVVKNMGSIDVMVANAGICPPELLVNITAEAFQRVYAVNVNGVFYCYKHAARQMIKQGRGGRMIAASSLSGKQGWGLGLSAYSSSKFAIRGLTQSAAKELNKYGITVNAYAPGIVDTDMVQQLARYVTQLDEEGISELQSFSNVTSPNNVLTPDDVAALVSYLASKEAEKITGQSVSINNGLYCD